MVETLKINDDGWPKDAMECKQCAKLAVIRMDGQNVCLNCGTTNQDEQE